ncbi:MAG TPA: hypothetical protein VMW68_09015, partial [Methyloceanibacter sp.]|nr:hypothetical protein [Methyloceanibacter sp.]
MNSRLTFAVLGLAPAILLLCPDAGQANRRACQNLEQAYAQIARGASTVQVNNTLFSATDKGCTELARLALKDGASLESRDRFGSKPLAHAAASGQAELVTLYLDHGAPI